MAMIFVTYSHLDGKWFDPGYRFSLIPWLENALRLDSVTLWYDRSDDKGLQAGDEFEREITQTIDRADIALLLISEAFFSSEFIRKVELPRILGRVERREMVVIPVLLEPCDWQRFDFVATRQLLPGSPTPLIDYTESDRQWAHGRDQILSGIRRRIRPAEPPPPPPPSSQLRPPITLRRRWLVLILALAALVGGVWIWPLVRDRLRPVPTPTVVVQPTATRTSVATQTTVPTLGPTATLTARPPDAVVAAAKVDLREGPGSTYTIVNNYSKGAELVVLGRSAGQQWLKVRAPDGKVGWARVEYLQVNVDINALEVGSAPPSPTPSAPQAGATKVLERAGITMVYVPAGEFLMGSTDSDPDASADEKPQHRVYLDGYWIGQTEVTNAQYRRFIDANGYSTPSYWSTDGWAWKESNGVTQPIYWNDSAWNGADYPVVAVSWYEAEAYAKWAVARLPTEAQWEYAARGGPLSRGYEYAGGNSADEAAWYDSNSENRLHPVAGKKANELGLYDMSGNVWEWTADWYDAGYYAASPRDKPGGPSAGTQRVLRGGSWYRFATYLRCTYRSKNDPRDRYFNLGFRVAE